MENRGGSPVQFLCYLILFLWLTATSAYAAPKPNPYYIFLRANMQAYQGEMDSSLEDLREVIKAYPNSPFLKIQLAKRLAELQRFDEAMELLNEALALQPDVKEGMILQGKILEAKGDLAEADRIFAKALRTASKDEELIFLRAQNLVQQKKYPAAIGVLESYLHADPESKDALFLIATIQANNLQEYGKAIENFQRLLDLDPDNSQVRHQIAQVYLKENKIQPALEQYLEIEHRSPQDLSIQLQVAFLYQESDDFPSAIAQFQKILDAHPHAHRIYYYLGVLYEKKKDVAQALEAYQQVAPESSLYKDAVLRRALILRDQGKSAAAKKLAISALHRLPQVPQLYQLVSYLHEEDEEFSSAVAVLKQGIKKNPKDENLYFNLGSLYDKLDKKEESIQMMREVLKINPRNASALNFIGYTYAEMGKNLEEAEQLIRQAMAIKPDDGFMIDSLGWVYFQKGDFKRAQQEIQRANRLLPKEPVIIEHLGDIALKMQQSEKARRFFERALKLGKEKENPDPKEIDRVEEKLKQLK